MSILRRKYRLAELSFVVKRDNKRNKLVSYFLHHINALLLSLDRLICTPFSSLLTVTVIAIALSLPTGLLLLLQNVKQISQNWNRDTQISVFLKMDVKEAAALDLARTFQEKPQVAGVRYVSPDEGLKTLQNSLDVSDVLAELKNNPLPAVLILTPKPTYNTPREIDALLYDIKNTPEVATVRLDRMWVERLYYLINFAHQSVLALYFLFGLGVIIIIGNTIRLAMQNSKREIKVFKLIGATDAFVRRPFLYTGLCYGLLGGMLAWFIVTLSIMWLQTPVRNLMLTYGSNFVMQGVDLKWTCILLLVGAFLGLIGAWFAVSKHLRKA